jgi:hypothetical protein
LSNEKKAKTFGSPTIGEVVALVLQLVKPPFLIIVIMEI